MAIDVKNKKTSLDEEAAIYEKRVLIGTEHGEDLVRRLREEGIPAAIIGRVTDGNDRTICRGEETRFLTPP